MEVNLILIVFRMAKDERISKGAEKMEALCSD